MGSQLVWDTWQNSVSERERDRVRHRERQRTKPWVDSSISGKVFAQEELGSICRTQTKNALCLQSQCWELETGGSMESNAQPV